MITDLVQIQRLGEKKRDDNNRFRKHLKSHVFVVRKFKQIAADVENAIDCKECGNCCRVAKTPISERDVVKLAKFLGMSFSAFVRDYTLEDEEEGRILRRDDESGCVFLEGKLCSVYDGRPSNCELFPHMVKGDGSIPARMWQFIDRATYCPICYNTLEEWKKEVDFSPSAK
jgi:Fe-S-cluster containining protein